MTLKNTDKSFKIEVTNKQIIDGEAGEVTESAGGSYTQKNNKAYIRYSVSGAAVTVITDGKEASIKRSGDVSSSMTYKRGVKTTFLYRTPYGGIPMEIDTKTLNASFDETGGTLEIRYDLTAGGEKYENNITITVKGDTYEV